MYIYIYRTHTQYILYIYYTQNIYHNICNCRSSPLVAFNLHQGLPRPVSPKGNPKSCKRMSSPNCLAKLPSSRTHGRTLLFPLCAPHRLALSHQSTVAGMQAYVEDVSPYSGWTIEGDGNPVQLTLVKLLYSIVNPCNPIFSAWVLSECMIFVIYPKLPQLQNCSEKRSIHCLGKAVSQHYRCRDPSANCMIFGLLLQKHYLYRSPPFLTVWGSVLRDEVKQ